MFLVTYVGFLGNYGLFFWGFGDFFRFWSLGPFLASKKAPEQAKNTKFYTPSEKKNSPDFENPHIRNLHSSKRVQIDSEYAQNQY